MCIPLPMMCNCCLALVRTEGCDLLRGGNVRPHLMKTQNLAKGSADRIQDLTFLYAFGKLLPPHLVSIAYSFYT